MKISQFLLVLLVMTMAVVPVAFAGCQEKKKKPQEPTEESIAALQEAIDDLIGALKDKDVEECKASIDKISVKYDGGTTKLKSVAVAQIKKCLKNKDRSVRNAAISGLGQTGGDAIKILMKGAKAAKKEVTLQQRYLNSAGKLREEKTIPEFLKYLNNKDNNIIKTAIYALGNYNESSTKIRKEIVKSLLKRYASVASAANKPTPKTTDKARYEALYNPFESTLKKLTKQELKGANIWNKWFRKDGKKRKEW